MPKPIKKKVISKVGIIDKSTPKFQISIFNCKTGAAEGRFVDYEIFNDAWAIQMLIRDLFDLVK